METWLFQSWMNNCVIALHKPVVAFMYVQTIVITALKTVNKQLDRLAKTDIDEKVFSDYNEQFQSFAILALLLMIVEFLIFSRKNKWLSRINIFEVKDKS